MRSRFLSFQNTITHKVEEVAHWLSNILNSLFTVAFALWNKNDLENKIAKKKLVDLSHIGHKQLFYILSVT